MSLPTMDLKQAYEEKTGQYFDRARADMVTRLPSNPKARILEIGCGFGGTGEMALGSGKCGEYFGIEISEAAARVAERKLTGIVVGNVETLEFSWRKQSFDALIMSELLEHLVDPWVVLKRLIPLLRNNAIVMASSPNISQYQVILALIRGRWELADAGVMDRTHLRWFTPGAYRDMFLQAGFVVDDVRSVVPFSSKTRLINAMTLNRFEHMFMRQIFLIGHKPCNA